jgi:hypothetical protein
MTDHRRKENLRKTQMHGRTSLRYHQIGAWSSAVFATRTQECPIRMGVDQYGLEPEKDARISEAMPKKGRISGL